MWFVVCSQFTVLDKLRLKYCATLIFFKENHYSQQVIDKAKAYSKKNADLSINVDWELKIIFFS